MWESVSAGTALVRINGLKAIKHIIDHKHDTTLNVFEFDMAFTKASLMDETKFCL